MANYKQITDVSVMENVSENTMALVEDNGTLKRVPCGKGFSGGNVALIKSDVYTNALAGVAAAVTMDVPVYTCENMSYSEAREIIMSGESLQATIFYSESFDGNTVLAMMHARRIEFVINSDGEFIAIAYAAPGYDNEITYLFWTPDGFSSEPPFDIGGGAE